MGIQNVDGVGNTIAGEWGQVDIGELISATELRLTTNNAYNDRAPREFRLLGSTDNTNWTTIIHKTEAGFNKIILQLHLILLITNNIDIIDMLLLNVTML